MRISDWSSDVCSSDLVRGGRQVRLLLVPTPRPLPQAGGGRMNMALSGIITVMERAARKAGTKLRRDFGEIEHLQVSQKGPADFVSKADQAAERTLYDELGHARPGWGFLKIGRAHV